MGEGVGSTGLGNIPKKNNFFETFPQHLCEDRPGLNNVEDKPRSNHPQPGHQEGGEDLQGRFQ